MTRISPAEVCATCGGLLVPPELTSEQLVPTHSDYVCLTCHTFYCWAGKPPQLVVTLPVVGRAESGAPLSIEQSPLRVLFVEDSPDDMELEARELRNAGMQVVAERVWTEAQFSGAVDGFNPDLIICDFSLAGVNGMTILRMSCDLCPAVPFMFVSGTIGGDRAAEALENGAADYLEKDRRELLPVRVRRLIDDARKRRAR